MNYPLIIIIIVIMFIFLIKFPKEQLKQFTEEKHDLYKEFDQLFDILVILFKYNKNKTNKISIKNSKGMFLFIAENDVLQLKYGTKILYQYSPWSTTGKFINKLDEEIRDSVKISSLEFLNTLRENASKDTIILKESFVEGLNGIELETENKLLNKYEMEKEKI